MLETESLNDSKCLDNSRASFPSPSIRNLTMPDLKRYTTVEKVPKMTFPKYSIYLYYALALGLLYHAAKIVFQPAWSEEQKLLFISHSLCRGCKISQYFLKCLDKG